MCIKNQKKKIVNVNLMLHKYVVYIFDFFFEKLARSCVSRTGQYKFYSIIISIKLCGKNISIVKN